MSTKPRASKFRFGRTAPTGDTPAKPAKPAAPASPFENTDDGFGDRVFPTAAASDDVPKADMSTPGEAAAEAEIAAIRAEGLTGRQLRMARRVAQKNGINATSDFEAVRLLRQKGINPFKHANMLELVVGEAAGAKANTQQLPQTVSPAGPQLPTPDISAEDRRAREIIRVQRDIAKRRRRRLALLFVRLAAFVLFPTFLAGYYFYNLATPMYGTKSEFIIQQADPQGMSGAGSLFSGTAMATAQDSITVQSYLQSREAMLRLDADHGFKAHFSDLSIDPIQRLEADASNEDAYKVYRRNVKISYDPTEGIIKMEVIAADPQVSATFSEALISYAEEQVDQLTQRLRENQMADARQNYLEAEANVQEAQRKVVELQEMRGIMSAEAEVSLLMNQIGTFEVELIQERLELEELLENSSPNATRVRVAENNIARLEKLIADMRAQMSENGGNNASLASITGELMMTEADLQTRRMLLAQSLQQMETARIEANRQVRYLSTGVSPVAPDDPSYPRAFENTAVSFLILAGIYLMMSLTASILREQVSA